MRSFRVFRLLNASVTPMANSRDRRRRRRMQREAGLQVRPKPPSPPPTVVSVPFWTRIPRWLYAVGTVLAIVITLLEGYPWLSVEEGPILDARNPLTEMFRVVNGGYVAVTDLDANCNVTIETSNHVLLDHNNFSFSRFADYLAHDGRTTIPCFRSIGHKQLFDGSKLDVTITYALYHLNISVLRRSQTFHFKSVPDSSGILHWVFLS